MLIRTAQFSGIVPRLDPIELPFQNAVIAENVDLTSKKAVPIKETGLLDTLDRGDYVSVYPYQGSYLKWVSDVDVVESPIRTDPHKRIYYTGSGSPKVRGLHPVTGQQVEYDLGIPRPTATPVVVAQDRSIVDFTRSWHGFYEEPDGTQVDNADFTEGTSAGQVQELRPGKSYRLNGIPARVSATTNAIWVLCFDAYDSSGILLGRVYPQHSKYAANSDLYINGFKVTGQQMNLVNATFALAYDQTRVADQTVYRSYVYNFVSRWGEEGPPSPPSSQLAIDPSQQAVISGFQTSVAGTRDIAFIRIYRTITGTAGGQFQFVADIAFGSAGYTDKLSDQVVSQNEIMPSTNWYPPASDVVGIEMHPAGFCCGWQVSRPRTLLFTEIGLPHAWNPGYGVNVQHDIVSVKVSGNAFIVTTKGIPYIISGDAPDAMTKIDIALKQPNVSKRGTVRDGGIVYYPSADGLVAIDASGNSNVVTSQSYTKEQWSQITPSNLIAAVYDQRYHGFSGSASVIIGLNDADPSISTTTETAQGVYAITENDTLIMIQGNQLVSWRAGANFKTMRWRGRPFEVSRPVSFSCGYVRAAGYPITLRIYNLTGSAVIEKVVADSKHFRLKTVHDADYWAVEIEGTFPVYAVAICTSMEELKKSTQTQ